jgi:hypothetical protein
MLLVAPSMRGSTITDLLVQISVFLEAEDQDLKNNHCSSVAIFCHFESSDVDLQLPKNWRSN